MSSDIWVSPNKTDPHQKPNSESLHLISSAYVHKASIVPYPKIWDNN